MVNAVNEVTKEVAKFVEFLKDDKTIEGDYMTVGEWVDGMVQDGIAEGLEKGLQQGIEKGIQQGVEYNLIGQIKKKILKNKQLPQIADELEVEIDDIKNIYETVVANQDKAPEEIYKILNHKE